MTVSAGRETFDAARTDRLLAEYTRLPGLSDELLDASGRPRPHWQPLLEALSGDPADVDRSFALADRHQRDSGVYYRVYDAGESKERPWRLSHVPLVLPEAEWRTIADGLTQRATLLEAVLADVYGEGRLVADGALPAAVVAGSPDFLHPVVGTPRNGARRLQVYAADLGRGPDGRWWVLGDRAQAPSGMGYALENRIALSRAIPDLYARMTVKRLAPFFQAWRGALASQADSDASRIGLLTPGPLNETYFEHAYLSRYLGFLLVEGGDLTVRDDAVYVRTIGGLKRVDVIVRRLDSEFADPVELDPASQIGVPGLMQAVRRRVRRPGQCTRIRSAGIARPAGFPSGTRRAGAGGRTAPSQHGDVVVRPGQGTRLCPGRHGRPGLRAGLHPRPRLAVPWRAGPGRGARRGRAGASSRPYRQARP